VPVQTVPEPGVPTEDAAILGFLQTAELAARDLYGAAIEAGNDDDLYVGIRDNHQAYSDRLSAQLGRSAPARRAEALYSEWEQRFQASGAEFATAASELESTLLATWTEALGRLVGADGARTGASILMVEARHAAVLADLAGNGDDLAAVLENSAEPLQLNVEAQG
jgi:hypothetical protein